MSEHPSLQFTPTKKPEETTLENVKTPDFTEEIAVIQRQNAERLEQVQKIRESLDTLSKEEKYLNLLEKEALTVLIKRYGGTVPPEE